MNTNREWTEEEARCAAWFAERGWTMSEQQFVGEIDGKAVQFDQIVIVREKRLPNGHVYVWHQQLPPSLMGWEEAWPTMLSLAKASLERGSETIA